MRPTDRWVLAILLVVIDLVIFAIPLTGLICRLHPPGPSTVVPHLGGGFVSQVADSGLAGCGFGTTYA